MVHSSIHLFFRTSHRTPLNKNKAETYNHMESTKLEKKVRYVQPHELTKKEADTYNHMGAHQVREKRSDTYNHNHNHIADVNYCRGDNGGWKRRQRR